MSKTHVNDDFSPEQWQNIRSLIGHLERGADTTVEDLTRLQHDAAAFREEWRHLNRIANHLDRSERLGTASLLLEAVILLLTLTLAIKLAL
jgi:hypothetical protein